MSPTSIQRCWLEFQYHKDGIPTSTPQKPKLLLPCVPSILCIQHRNPISGCSKAPWGLSVLSRVTGIFTGTTISPGGLLRQCPNAFHAGQNLPDKEFRYLRTVIVTAAVHWGFNSMLAHLLLTFQHRAGVSRSYGVNLPSSLTTLLPLALESSSYLPVSVCGTGAAEIHMAFLATLHAGLRYLFPSITTGTNSRLQHFRCVPMLNSFGGDGISTVCASATPSGLTLAPD